MPDCSIVFDMLYSAPPSVPPPNIRVSTAEAIGHSAPSPEPASRLELLPQRSASSLARSDQARPLTDQASANLTTTTHFVQQAGVSRAALLGDATTAGYLVGAPSLSPQATFASPMPELLALPQTKILKGSQANHKLSNPTRGAGIGQTSQNTAIARMKPKRSTQLAERFTADAEDTIQEVTPASSPPTCLLTAADCTQKTSSAPAQPSTPVSVPIATSIAALYSLSGVRQGGDRQANREADLMARLHQAMVIEGRPDPTAAPLLLVDAKSSGLETWLQAGGMGKVAQSKVAQSSDTSPLLQPIPTSEPQPASPLRPVPTVPQPTPPKGEVKPTPPQTQAPEATPAPRLVELTADKQEYDQERQIFTAEGKVLMRFQGALLDADRVQVNLVNRIAVAEGNVALTRGTQVLRGQRFEYNFVQGVGTIQGARGEIFIPAAGKDIAGITEAQTGGIIDRPVSDRVTANQPLANVSSPGGIVTGIGAGQDVGRVPGALPTGGSVNRLRFEAERVDFTPDGWEATNIQITNDPFSPPELVLKADRAKLTRLSPLRDEVKTTRARLVFDQRTTIPLPFSGTVLDRRERQPPLVQFGIDTEDRGGVFIERPFNILTSDQVRLTLTPQIFLQRMIFDNGNPADLDNYGFKADLRVNAGPSTQIRGKVSFTSLDFSNIENQLRASLRAQQLIGTHTLAVEYSYRDRLFNGSLGFQTVQSSIGAVLTSPNIVLGKTGIVLNYQAGIQNINSSTDRLDLLAPVRENNRINLSRFQASAAISRGFTLWQGKPLPATRNEGLRFSPNPIVPYVSLGASLRGVFSQYSNGESQENLIGAVSLNGQFGHFSRQFFDYTAFNLTYIQFVGRGQSPFLFDRTVDNRILSAGITQQIYGPIRLGFQTSINLDNGNQISTDYILEYSRRSYGITVRYNPILSIGAIGLRISDFNWTGNDGPFEGTDVTPVEGGLRRERR